MRHLTNHIHRHVSIVIVWKCIESSSATPSIIFSRCQANFVKIVPLPIPSAGKMSESSLNNAISILIVYNDTYRLSPLNQTTKPFNWSPYPRHPNHSARKYRFACIQPYMDCMRCRHLRKFHQTNMSQSQRLVWRHLETHHLDLKHHLANRFLNVR